VTAGGATPVDAIFDSTGLAPGDYSGHLCVSSNDPDEPLVEVPVDMTVIPPPVSSIVFTKTVGTDPNACAPTSAISVGSGTDVYYCFNVENDGNVILSLHDLVDSEIGTVLDDFAFALTPGSSVSLTSTVNITQTTVNTATWTAFNAGPTDTAVYTDTATVTVTPPLALSTTGGSVTPSSFQIGERTGLTKQIW
jgi:hypothetical protein